MKLGVIALDYDGTTAQHDRLDPAVRDAIADARTRGITVIIVTGRSLDELRRVAGDLHFVDVVVAENGAVLHFPGNDYTTVLAAPVPAALIDELASARHHSGAWTVSRRLRHERRAPNPDVIRQMELPPRPGLQSQPRHGVAPGGEQGDGAAGRARHASPVATQRGGCR